MYTNIDNCRYLCLRIYTGALQGVSFLDFWNSEGYFPQLRRGEEKKQTRNIFLIFVVAV